MKAQPRATSLLFDCLLTVYSQDDDDVYSQGCTGFRLQQIRNPAGFEFLNPARSGSSDRIWNTQIQYNPYTLNRNRN